MRNCGYGPRRRGVTLHLTTRQNPCLEQFNFDKILFKRCFMKAIASSRKRKSKRKSLKKQAFDAQAFLDSAGVSRKVVVYRKLQKVYSQGDCATSVMDIQEGGVKLSVVNEVGKEAVLASLGAADFLRGGGLAGPGMRPGAGAAVAPASLPVSVSKQ